MRNPEGVTVLAVRYFLLLGLLVVTTCTSARILDGEIQAVTIKQVADQKEIRIERGTHGELIDALIDEINRAKPSTAKFQTVTTLVFYGRDQATSVGINHRCFTKEGFTYCGDVDFAKIVSNLTQ